MAPTAPKRPPLTYCGDQEVNAHEAAMASDSRWFASLQPPVGDDRPQVAQLKKVFVDIADIAVMRDPALQQSLLYMAVARARSTLHVIADSSGKRASIGPHKSWIESTSTMGSCALTNRP